jgi:hypothetical protein
LPRLVSLLFLFGASLGLNDQQLFARMLAPAV